MKVNEQWPMLELTCQVCSKSFEHRDTGGSGSRPVHCTSCRKKTANETKAPRSNIRDRVNPNKRYIESPNGLVGEILAKKIKAGQEVAIHWQHGGYSHHATSRFPHPQ